ncbi:MAG: formyltransferase family protein, partial [Ignavibacteria bacterium]
MKIAVFVSGRGSNLQAIINSDELRNLIEIKAVFSDKIDCPAFEIARSHSIPTYAIGSPQSVNPPRADKGRISYHELSDLLIQFNVELIVLAGFLKLIP